MLNSFLQHIEQYISRHNLLHHDEKYLVALSGGMDSVCLLRVLLALKYRVEAVHCNFQLRGEESVRDELFCKQLCTSLGIPLHLVHFDTKEYAKLHGVSIEMAARTLRYTYFEQLRNDIHAAGICVGHHVDDSVETLLLNLIRSTGINGLTGIAPKNGFVLRPMLCVMRCDIECYMQSIRQNYITDSSNLVPDVQRNKLRLEVIPLLEAINPAVKSNIAKTANRLNDAAMLLNEMSKNRYQWQKNKEGFWCFAIDAIANEYVLWQLLRQFNFSPAQTEQIYPCLHGESGKVWQSKTHEVLIDRNYIFVANPLDFPSKIQMLPEAGTYIYSPTVKIQIKIEIKTNNQLDYSNLNVVYLDADKLSFPFTLRPMSLGDSFVPYGMNGKKLLSDFTTNCKMSIFEKRQQLVLENARHQIVWLVGRRTDQRFCVDAGTKKLLKIELMQLVE